MPKRAPVFLRADVRARLFLLTSREHLFELLLDAREEATTWRALALAGLERLHELSTQLARERSARHRLIAEYRLLRVHTPEAKK